MKKLLSSMMLCFSFTILSFAQTDATLSTQLIGTWNMENMDVGGQLITPEQLNTTIQNEFLEDGTTVFDDMTSGKKKTGKWKIISGVIIDPDQPNAPSPKILKIDAESLVLEVLDNGSTIKMNMKRVIK